MNEVGFERVVGEDGQPELLPYVDGVPLTQLVERFEAARQFDVVGGYGPRWLASDMATEFLPRPRWRRARVPLLACDCGMTACWPLEARVRGDGEDVVWHSFRQPHRRDRDYSGFGPFRFDASAYRSAVREALDA